MARHKMVGDVKVDLTPEEEKARDEAEAQALADLPAVRFERLRELRDVKLAKCDWTQIPDNALSDEDKKKWADYRKELRDLPSTFDGSSILGDITWPTKP